MAFYIKKTINGVPKGIPLTTDSGQGLPLGAITAFYGTTPPNGYLICDGSEFSTTDYPALYTFLGDNHTPDLRECVLVGAGQNSSDTIADHDVYTLGEFKDDQLQSDAYQGKLVGAVNAVSWGGTNNPSIYLSTHNTRTGTTTHGKQKGVNYIIKAVIGPIEDSASDQVVQNINNSRSYSTEEVNTGKTWIDGKTIYRKTFYWATVPATVDLAAMVIDRITNQEGTTGERDNPQNQLPITGYYDGNSFYLCMYYDNVTKLLHFSATRTLVNAYLTLEYTKTTDQATV